MRDMFAGRLGHRLWLRGILVALVAAQWAAIDWVGSNGGFAAFEVVSRPFRSRPTGATSLQEWQQALARDPRPGYRFAQLTVKESEGATVTIGGAQRPGGILFISSCTDCAASFLTYWDKLQKRHPEAELWVVPITEELNEVRRFKQRHGLDVPIVTEGNARIAAIFNPFFLPRAYRFDSHNQLVYVQPPSTSTQTALDRVRAAFVSNRPNRSGLR